MITVLEERHPSMPGDGPHVFEAAETHPNGVRVRVEIEVPTGEAWPDVRECLELAQMGATSTMTHLVKHRKMGQEHAGAAAAEPSKPPMPPYWPPQPGDIWQDIRGNRWACLPMPGGKPYLACLAYQAEDSAEQIWDDNGPLTRIFNVLTKTIHDEEPPF